MKLLISVIAVVMIGGVAAASADMVRPAAGPVVMEDADTEAWKAVLYEEGPGPNGLQFAGSAVWRTEAWWRVAPGSGRKPDVGVRAHIEIPERNMSMRLWLQRNDDKQLPASHTVEVEFALPSDFPHGGIANVPGLLMKAGETARGVPLNGVSVKIADGLFIVGLSHVEADRQRNVELLRDRPWIDVPIVYGDGRRAILAVQKGAFGDRALAVLDLPAAEPTSTDHPRAAAAPSAPAPKPVRVVPIAPPLPEVSAKPWPIRDASPSEGYAPLNQALEAARQLAALPPAQPREPVRPKLTLLVLDRPTWAWPPGKFWWAVAPGLPSASRTWRAGWQPVLSEMIKIASSIEVPSVLRARLPPWVQDISMAVVTAESLPPWPRVRAPDFRLPTGPSRYTADKHLVPPARFVRWSDRLETVLSDEREVDRRCRAAGARPPSGSPPNWIFHGCARGAVGRCFIVRVDDPGIARHELAHCNGWRHPQ